MASFATRFHASSPNNDPPPKRTSWGDPRDGSGSGSGSGNGNGRDPPAHANDRAFPHVKDLVAAAQPTFDPSVALPEYLKEAESCLQISKTSLSFGKADIAFRDYLKASDILLNIIPRHKDFGFFEYNNQSWSQRNKAAKNVVKSMGAQMEGVRKIIEDNNIRHNTRQRSTTSGYDAVALPSSYIDQQQNRPQSHASPPSTDVGVQHVPESLRVQKARPTSVSKPDHLRSGSLPTANDLSSRFARLRTNGAGPAPAPGSLEMPDAASFTANGVNGAPKPFGPRDMPAVPPSLPPKLPVAATGMPKPPDPTFSAAQSARASREIHRPPTERNKSYYGQPIANISNPQLQRHKEEVQPYRPRTPNGMNLAIVSKSNSAEIPHHDIVDAELLQRYISKYNVLLVDIRDRPQFDEGHIFATSIICIEPLELKEGMSAEMLEERLVLAPDKEQNLFARRNEFDIVVYYDQSTSDNSYLRGSPTMTRAPHLRAFFDTLYEFNEYKPLKDGRPPALLRGGLDAWVDLMGSHSLATSRTAAMLGTTRQRPTTVGPGRPLGRQRLVSTNSRVEVRDRRLRNQKFLDENEQRAWRQQAQQEEVVHNDDAHASDNEYAETEDEPPASPYVPDYESFLRRFPATEQQSMVAPPRRPVVPAKRYEPPPLPSMPSRPAPAVPRPSYTGQAEIIQAQAPLARVTSASRQQLYSSSQNLTRRRIPRTGLTNFGVTCYMNSTLQCLSATIPLANFFLDEGAYKRNVQKNWKGSSGIMPEIFANVIRSLWKGDVDMIKPTTFRNFCGRMNREWVIDRQQDAKEFFDFLVDCLHEDLNIAWERTPLKPLTTEQEMQRERYRITEAAPIEWQRYEHRDRSFVSSLFAGQHASRLRCLTCNNTSTTYEAFYSISTEIPRSRPGDIYECLQSYTKEERLAPDERWKCPHCKCERDATKQIILTRLPQFLVIHFKRFSASKTESARKIHSPIDFPLHGLTMDPYVLSPKQPQPQPQSDQINGEAKDKDGPDPATLPPFTYDCYGVLRHLGSSGDGGHYISMVKDQGRGCWRKFDDERTVDFDPAQLSARDRLQNGEAYILFFQRR
ncbi:ubiquitin-specific protease doa4 [Exophiala xenobiotica]|uniref:Ubiquitin-specific protease doa4 n=1 Tax=Lithohypha guttulata TaxID=1690604 RepID=A0ABR0KJL6_9EURO|nr:ubiquitin-specific protease doa4 [Lithohypha guttulata]KAK5324674.1 ubiquitin-specific protease doa4 [Exophiala xenobiotica]